MSERVLVIDCATPALSLALFTVSETGDEACIAGTHVEIGRGHAEALLPAIAALPDGGRCDHILVDIGPGSFTGVRVGLAAATGLGFAWQIPVEGYGCLDLVAAMAQHKFGVEEDFAVVMVGGHGELFWTIPTANADPATAEPGEVHSTPIADLAGLLATPRLIGSGAQILVDARGWGEAMPLLPDARDLFLLAPGQRKRPAKPIYGRGADAKPMAHNAPATPDVGAS